MEGLRIRYVCECCRGLISELQMDRLDEERLGFNCLTAEEKEDIISYDEKAGTLTVTSLCDDCMESETEDMVH